MPDFKFAAFKDGKQVSKDKGDKFFIVCGGKIIAGLYDNFEAAKKMLEQKKMAC
jgi:hypothetical protein